MAKEKESKELVKVEPSRAISPFDEMERWVDEAFSRPFSLFHPLWRPRLRSLVMQEFSPSVDIFEDGDDVVVKAEAPGMKKEDMDVKIEGDTITVTGEKKTEKKVEKKENYRVESS